MRYSSIPRSRSKKRLVLICALCIGGLIAVLTILELTNTTNFISLSSQDSSNQEARTTSDLPSAQSDFTVSSDNEESATKDPGNTLREDTGTAVVTDNNGEIQSKDNNPISSSDGGITIYTPLKSSLLKSGQEIAGTTSIPRVNYRVIDDRTGVIATGSLKVVEGKFSGSLNFSTAATEGRIDIFATRADGTEYSNLEIPVRFK